MGACTYCSPVRAERALGMLPVNALELTSKYCRFPRVERHPGMGPERLLKLIASSLHQGRGVSQGQT